MTGMSAPAKSRQRWDRCDLVRRLIEAVATAERAVRVLVEDGAGDTARNTAEDGADNLLRGKVVAETAMLLLCAWPILDLDERLRARVELGAALLVRHARRPDVLAAICVDPGLARGHAVAHIILSRLGYPDRDVDHLLASSLAMGADFGPERLPHRGLEQEWLARTWNAGRAARAPAVQDLADLLLARPADPLSLHPARLLRVHARGDVRERPRRATAAPAEAGSRYRCRCRGDPGLQPGRRRLRPDRRGALDLADAPAGVESGRGFRVPGPLRRGGRLGFLPGSQFDTARHQSLAGEERARYALATSYHTAYVMGFLCAAALRDGRAPGDGCRPRAARPERDAPSCGSWTPTVRQRAGTSQPARSHLASRTVSRRWSSRSCSAGRGRGEILRRVRSALEVGLAYGLADGPAPMQAAALLRRARALDELLGRRGGSPSGRASVEKAAVVAQPKNSHVTSANSGSSTVLDHSM